MPTYLTTLPYEVLSSIVEYVSFEDVRSLARTSKQLQFLEREENICKKILEGKLAFCDEAVAARKAGRGYASALRRVGKRHESVATATPFSMAIVAFGDDFLYCRGNLCYILDDSLRILHLHRSAHNEVVVSIHGLLRKFLLESERSSTGRFLVLYCNEGIVSCLYISSAPDSVAYLIAFNIEHGEVLLTYVLPSTERIFVRHTSEFLYYGTYSGENYYGHKKWVLRGYNFKEEEWLEQSVFLGDLNGSEIGSSVCFEIYNDYFYALSNQTNYEVEEVDWTSFYHCVRFPLLSPSKTSLENTAMDKHMWRRQHREGPIDDRWASLMLNIDEATGDLNIVETRREFLFGAGRSHRTYYTTKLVFPNRSTSETIDADSSISSASEAINLQVSPSTSGIRRIEKQELAALTNDRLALTLKPSDNPHWFPPQTRYPRNMHSGDDGPYIFSQTYLRYYNSSAKSILDLVDEPLPTSPNTQRLRLRVGSRKLDPPAVDCNGLLIREASDPLTGEILYGLNDRYTNCPAAFWPPEQDPYGPVDGRLEDLSMLMNPPSHLGNVEATGDDRSFVYATGGKDRPRAIVFVNFDPAIKLHGLRRWRGSGRLQESKHAGMNYHEESVGNGKGKGKGKERETDYERSWKGEGHAIILSDELPLGEIGGHCMNNNGDERWIWRERAMYTAIDRGYDFGL